MLPSLADRLQLPAAPAAGDAAFSAQPESPLRMRVGAGAVMPLAAVSPVLRGQKSVLQPIVDILHKQLRKGKRVSGQPVTSERLFCDKKNNKMTKINNKMFTLSRHPESLLATWTAYCFSPRGPEEHPGAP